MISSKGTGSVVREFGLLKNNDFSPSNKSSVVTHLHDIICSLIIPVIIFLFVIFAITFLMFFLFRFFFFFFLNITYLKVSSKII